eukprot:TRINITY_DN8862_c0_g3_i1.p1 TRINITY_DN8862_c0_g3~~TRINITY_DN8862_c0_g3_i1.p1  ORF type:complete len:259 (+),score=61.54 TRINITY_DN8862_c0_g3_i1:373-1149(+)
MMMKDMHSDSHGQGGGGGSMHRMLSSPEDSVTSLMNADDYDEKKQEANPASLHFIPIVVIICFFILWLFHRDVVLTASETAVLPLEGMKEQKQLPIREENKAKGDIQVIQQVGQSRLVKEAAKQASKKQGKDGKVKKVEAGSRRLLLLEGEQMQDKSIAETKSRLLREEAETEGERVFLGSSGGGEGEVHGGRRTVHSTIIDQHFVVSGGGSMRTLKSLRKGWAFLQGKPLHLLNPRERARRQAEESNHEEEEEEEKD